jgi:M6 family metalloprotease-like protein
MFSILFLQLGWIPDMNSSLTNTVFKANEDVKPISGHKRAIIILADFLDVNFTNEGDFPGGRTLIEQRASNMTSYFSEVSYNKMSLQVDITNETYTLPHNMLFYADKMDELVRDCISQSDPEINYNSYDYFLVVHASGLANPRTYLGLHIQTDDGKIIDSCAVLGEYHWLKGFCHETAHLLGLPDLYPEASRPQGDVGCWDLMGIGTPSQEFDGPPQLSAWTRIRLGWINSSLIKTVNVSDVQENIELYDLETLPKEFQTKAIKVAITSNVYYLVELRNKILSDKNLPSNGILIYRCDESASDEESHSVTVMDTSLSDFQFFEKSHPDAAFDNDRQLFCDPVNGIAIEVLYFYPSPWPEIPTTSLVHVYRKQMLHSLKLALPQSGITVTIDDKKYVSDENGEVVALVLNGNHTVTVALPSGPFYATASFRWSDGDVSNPREIQVLSDVALAFFYSLNYLPIMLVLSIIVALLTICIILLNRRYKHAVLGKLVSGARERIRTHTPFHLHFLHFLHRAKRAREPTTLVVPPAPKVTLFDIPPLLIHPQRRSE